MAGEIITPNMSLVLPGVGITSGPQFATDINSSLTIIDQHNHTAGSGVQITPSAININSDLPLNNFSLTSIAALTFTAQSVVPSNGSLFVSGVDLHYVDGNGNNVTITTGGAVNATSSGISSGTATASFVAGVLVVNAASNTPANIQGASVLLGNNVANTKYLTLAPPNSMGANYTVTLPALPAQTNVMTLDTSGNMGSVTYDAVGQGMTSTGSNAISAVRTRGIGTTVGAGGVAVSVSCGNFFTTSTTYVSVTNLSVTITSSGRPIVLLLSPSGTPGINVANGFIQTSTSQLGYIRIQRGSTPVVDVTPNTQNGTVPPGIQAIDEVGAGTYTYSVLASTGTGGSGITVNNLVLVAYEL